MAMPSGQTHPIVLLHLKRKKRREKDVKVELSYVVATIVQCKDGSG